MSGYRVPQVGERGIASVLRRDEGVGIAGRQLLEAAIDLPGGPGGYQASVQKSAMVGLIHVVGDYAFDKPHAIPVARAVQSAVVDYGACLAANMVAADKYLWVQPLISGAAFPLVGKILKEREGTFMMEFLLQAGSSAVGEKASALVSGWMPAGEAKNEGRRLLEYQSPYSSGLLHEAARSVTVGATHLLAESAFYGFDGKSAATDTIASAGSDFLACQGAKAASPQNYYWLQPLLSGGIYPLATCALGGKRGPFVREFLLQAGSTVAGTAVYSIDPPF